LLIGALHWILGGIVCWAFESVKFQQAPPREEPKRPDPASTVWHPPSDFVLPGGRHSLLPPSVALSQRPRKSLPDYFRASGGRPPR
jgi:hypothetical protein